MSNYLRRAIILGSMVATAFGGYFLWSQHRSESTEAHASLAEPSSTSDTLPNQAFHDADFAPKAAKDGLYAVLDSGASLATAIEAVAGPSGEISDPRMISLIERAALVCGDDFDPHGALGENSQADPTRAWAVARVVKLCEGFDYSKYKIAGPIKDLSKVLRESGKGVAASESMAAIRTAPDYSQLFSAGQILLETGQFPLAEAIPNGSKEFGMTELMTAWSQASTLISCGEAGGCGPNSLEVAAYCSNAGCPPGSTMQQAFQHELSAGDYRAVSGFYGWLLRQRKI
ncbi:hypothetical protein [Lysobacter fragariae]